MSKYINTADFLMKEDQEQERIEKAAKRLMSKIPAVLPQQVLYIIAPISTLQPVKIGITLTPRKRLCHLQIGNWQKLDIYKLFRIGDQVYKLEQHLHSYLRSKQITGEWFDIEASDAEGIVKQYVKDNINYFKKG